MKISISTNLRTKALAFASLFCAGSASVQAQFIDLSAGNVKVVFKEVLVIVNGAPVSTTQATASVTETDANGVITAKRMTFVQVSDGAGGTEQQVTQEATVATPDPVTGSYDVETTTNDLTTPVDANGTATGATTTVTTVVEEEDVESGDLDLPPSTTFTPIDPELEVPVVISAE